jgi:hypothetical protein
MQVCREPYSLSDLNNRFCHLTNCAVQQTHPSTAPSTEEQLWSTDQFSRYLDEHGYPPGVWIDTVLPAISALAKATFASAAHASWPPPRNQSFECFGLDILLDERLHPWLLEVNESPNLRTHGSHVLRPMLASLLDIVLPSASGCNPRSSGRQRVGAWRCL